MGLLIGLCFGLGCLLIWRAVTTEARPRRQSEPRWRVELTDLIAQAGIESVTPGQVVAASLGLGLFAFVATVVA